MNTDEKARMKNLRRRVKRARNFPENTCGASRHLHMIAERLAAGKPYPMLQDEPAHCADTMLAVLEALWKARTELQRLKTPNAPHEGPGAASSRTVPLDAVVGNLEQE